MHTHKHSLLSTLNHSLDSFQIVNLFTCWPSSTNPRDLRTKNSTDQWPANKDAPYHIKRRRISSLLLYYTAFDELFQSLIQKIALTPLLSSQSSPSFGSTPLLKFPSFPYRCDVIQDTSSLKKPVFRFFFHRLYLPSTLSYFHFLYTIR